MILNMTTSNITHANLAHFYGSEQIYFNPLFKAMKYTEGIRFLSRNGAGWLVDKLCILGIQFGKREEFMVATLKVTDSKALLVLDDGNDNVLHSEEIDYTDFPLPEITAYIEYGTIMLPSER
jgi:hypothetical protein